MVKTYYLAVTGKSAPDTAKKLEEFHNTHDTAVVDVGRYAFGPTEHLIEIWYYDASEAGFRSSYRYWTGGYQSVTDQVVEFYNKGETGSGFFNRFALSPTQQIFDIWWAPSSETGTVGGFATFAGKNFSETQVQMEQFAQANPNATESNKQRTVLYSGLHILDYMWDWD